MQNHLEEHTDPFDRRSVRALFIVIALILATLGAATPPVSAAATTATWQLMSGRLTDIDVGANGAVWAISRTPVAGGYTILQFVDGVWKAVEGGAVRVAVAPSGQPWIVNSDGRIFARSSTGWVLVTGSARDIAVADDGNVYIVGTQPRPGGFALLRYISVENYWTEIGGGATRIAAGSSVWVVNNNQRVFRGQANGWVALPGTARDVGARGNTAWTIGTAARPGGYTVQHFDGVAWDTVEGGAVAVAVGPGGSPWLVNSFGEVFRGTTSLGPRVCPIGTAEVKEATAGLYVDLLQPGERVVVSPDRGSSIRNGNIFQGPNGPAGRSELAPATFPLPGARQFSLLVSVGAGWSYVGENEITVQNTSGEPQHLRFRVNDDVPGNGSGQFTAGLTFTCRT